MPDGRFMQCKDIPDQVFLDAVRRTPSRGAVGWRLRWEVQEELGRAIGSIPTNLFLAKARRLIARGFLGGCGCGCRGDWYPTDTDEKRAA
jgi:hypothetical protein